MRLKINNDTNVNLYMLDGAWESFKQSPSVPLVKTVLSEAYNCLTQEDITLQDYTKYIGKVYEWLQTQV